MKPYHHCIVAAVAACLAIPTLASPSSAELEDSAKIIAAQLHKQGVACSMPKRATRDEQRSRPNENVWVVSCDEATYRVTLIPRRKADIVPISTDSRANGAECRSQCEMSKPAAPQTAQ